MLGAANTAINYGSRRFECTRCRPLLVGIGYGLSAVAKPLFPLANTALQVLAVRFAAGLTLALSTSLVSVFIGVGLWGLYLGPTEGPLMALVRIPRPSICGVRLLAFSIC